VFVFHYYYLNISNLAMMLLFRGALSSLQKQLATGTTTPAAAVMTSSSVAATVSVAAVVLVTATSFYEEQRTAVVVSLKGLNDGFHENSNDQLTSAAAVARGDAVFPRSLLFSTLPSQWRASSNFNNGALCQAAAAKDEKDTHGRATLQQLQSLAALQQLDVVSTTTASAIAKTKMSNEKQKIATRPYGIDVVLGSQWGDEGKGKLVDILSQVSFWVF
jgi:hypothetical protein